MLLVHHGHLMHPFHFSFSTPSLYIDCKFKHEKSDLFRLLNHIFNKYVKTVKLIVKKHRLMYSLANEACWNNESLQLDELEKKRICRPIIIEQKITEKSHHGHFY